MVSTYHAFAGQLLREYGLLSPGAGEDTQPIEPDTRLLSETELWQLAFDVVNRYDGALRTEKNPASVTAMVLRLSGQLAEHLVDTGQVCDTHVELERLVHTLPAGRYQRDRGPSQWLLRMLATQAERAELVPLVDALHRRMRAEKVMDFGSQMACAARLALTVPQVGEQLRSRYRVVLLDEYQDTGYAQRMLLSSLFGGGVDDQLALTAVGDPIQSIYGWRGASATNLPRFTTDFPMSDGSPAPVLELSTSWRNPPTTLHVANAVSADARRRSVAVHPLRSRPDAAPGTVRCALLSDVVAERDWVADYLQRCYQQAAADGVAPPTAAVLVRRNADAAPIAAALRARGVPVEVVGLAGLLSVPEVADVVAMLRLVADPTAGAAAMRVLTGPRWRLGARDVAALWHRASSLDGGQAARSGETAERIAEAVGLQADAAGLADALADPGPAQGYSAEGYRRIAALAEELSMLRAHLGHPLPDLVAEVRRLLGVDCEVRAASSGRGWTGTEQLDAFADVVNGYTERSSATDSLASVVESAGLPGRSRGRRERLGAGPGGRRAEPGAGTDRPRRQGFGVAGGRRAAPVGRIVPVDRTGPHLAHRCRRPPAVAAWGPVRQWPARCAGPGYLGRDRSKAVVRQDLRTPGSTRATPHRRGAPAARMSPSPAVEDTLLLSGHHWAATGIKPRGPSDFLCELKDIIDESAAAGQVCGVVEQWAPAPAGGDRNPMRDNVHEANWPVDPLGDRRADVQRGAALVAAAMSADGPTAGADDDAEDWAADVDALLQERARAGQAPAAALPSGLSVSSLVDLARDPEHAAQRLARRLPARPEPQALLGNAFHDWVERFYGAERLFDLADLPGAADSDIAQRDADELAALQDAFLASPWAAAHAGGRRGAVRDGHRRHGGPRSHRRGLRRARRRRDGRGLEDRRAATRIGCRPARRHPARRLPARVGRAQRLPGIVGAHGFSLRANRSDGRPGDAARP